MYNEESANDQRVKDGIIKRQDSIPVEYFPPERSGRYIQPQVKKAHDTKIRQLAQIGTIIFTSGNDGKIIAWDENTFSIIRVIETPLGPIWGLEAFGNFLIASSKEMTLFSVHGREITFEKTIFEEKKCDITCYELIGDAFYCKRKGGDSIELYKIRETIAGSLDFCFVTKIALPEKIKDFRNFRLVSNILAVRVSNFVNVVIYQFDAENNRLEQEIQSVISDYASGFGFDGYELSEEGASIAVIDNCQVWIYPLKQGGKQPEGPVYTIENEYGPRCLYWDKESLFVEATGRLHIFSNREGGYEHVYDSKFEITGTPTSFLKKGSSLFMGGDCISSLTKKGSSYQLRKIFCSESNFINGLLENRDRLFIGDEKSGRVKALNLSTLEFDSSAVHRDYDQRPCQVNKFFQNKDSLYVCFNTKLLELKPEALSEEKGEEIRTKRFVFDEMDISPCEKYIVIGDAEGKFMIYSKEGQELLNKKLNSYRTRSVLFYSNKGRLYLVSCYESGDIVIGEIGENKGRVGYKKTCQGTIKKRLQIDSILSAKIIDDKLYVCVDIASVAIQVFTLPDLKPDQTTPVIGLPMSAMTSTFYENDLYIGCVNGQIAVLSLLNLKEGPQKTYDCHGSHITAITISKDGRLLFVGNNGAVSVFLREKLELLATLHVFEDDILITTPPDAQDRKKGRKYEYFYNPSCPNPLDDMHLDFQHRSKREWDSYRDSVLNKKLPKEQKLISSYLKTLFSSKAVEEGTYGKEKIIWRLNGYKGKESEIGMIPPIPSIPLLSQGDAS